MADIIYPEPSNQGEPQSVRDAWDQHLAEEQKKAKGSS